MWQKINKTDLPPYLSWRGYNTMEHKPNEIIEVNGKKVAIDRSVGVTLLLVSTDKNGDLCCLLNKRGDSKDTGGLWNMPSGYLDWGETGEECAARELYEECGLSIPSSSEIKLVEVSTNPANYKQHVILRYIAYVPSATDFSLSMQNAETGEVSEIAWVKLSKLDNYHMAWGQCETIKRLCSIILIKK